MMNADNYWPVRLFCLWTEWLAAVLPFDPFNPNLEAVEP